MILERPPEKYYYLVRGQMIMVILKKNIELQREKWLDSIRGIACLIVLFAHIFSTVPTVGVLVSGCGKIGVWLFFILSGFWMYYPYCVQQKTFDMNDTLAFYIKRIFRIYPMYMVVLTVCIFLGYIDKMQFVKHLLLLQGWGHFWAIPVEMKFYLIAPVILFVFTRIKAKHSVILSAVMAIILAVRFPFTTYNENSICLFWYLPVFLLGMCTAYLYVHMKRRKNRIFDVVAGCLSICLIMIIPGVRELIWKIEPDGYLQNKYLFIGTIWSIMIICIVNSRYIHSVLEEAKILQWIGKISYSIYLIHFVVLQCICRYTENTYVKFAIVIGLSIILAAMAERFVERKAICIGKSIAMGIKSVNCVGRVTLCSMLAILGCIYAVVTEYKVYCEEQEAVSQNVSWEDRLYVPTMIQKCGDTYFIVDCWNSRILYADHCSKNLNDWNVLQDDAYLGGHTVASDGELYVFDNTDMNQILVYKKVDEELCLYQTIEGIESRPHYVLYNAENQTFYVIGSTSGIVYSFKNQNGELTLTDQCQLTEIQDSYVRSINIIDGDLYTVSGPGKIFQYEITDSSFELKRGYGVPECYSE